MKTIFIMINYYSSERVETIATAINGTASCKIWVTGSRNQEP